MFEKSSRLLRVAVGRCYQTLPDPSERIVWVESLRLVKRFVGEFGVLVMEIKQAQACPTSSVLER